MNYSYIKLDELYKMHMKNRNAIIIFDVHTKDLDEYINNYLITLKNCEFDTSLLLNPRIMSRKDKRIIILPLKNNKFINITNRSSLDVWAKQMGNVCSIEDFFNNNYRKTDEIKKATIIGNNLKKYNWIYYKAFDMNTRKNTEDYLKISILKHISNEANDIEQYLSALVSYLFTHKRLFVLEFKMCVHKDVISKEDISINVEPTSDSVKFIYNM